MLIVLVAVRYNAALTVGFPAKKIVYAGVGKADWEINLGLDRNIFCFNVESIAELEVINELAGKKGKVANICFRINPNVGAHTHAKITTGLAENKFGIAMQDMEAAIHTALEMDNVRFIGLHFHIGSQILDMSDFKHSVTASMTYKTTWKSSISGLKTSTLGGG